MYVTNQYVPGISSTSQLPGRAYTGCQWVAQNWTSALRMQAGDPCYQSDRAGYTIAVLGASYVPGLVSLFTLTASTGTIRLLQLGVQQANQYTPTNTSAWRRSRDANEREAPMRVHRGVSHPPTYPPHPSPPSALQT